MVHKPKKQEQQQNPFEGQPIQVKPIVPMKKLDLHNLHQVRTFVKMNAIEVERDV